MTPDERASRAERVIDETIEQLLELATHFTADGTVSGAHAGAALEIAAGALARNARIAGIDADTSRRSANGGASSSSS